MSSLYNDSQTNAYLDWSLLHYKFFDSVTLVLSFSNSPEYIKKKTHMEQLKPHYLSREPIFTISF